MVIMAKGGIHTRMEKNNFISYFNNFKRYGELIHDLYVMVLNILFK